MMYLYSYIDLYKHMFWVGHEIEGPLFIYTSNFSLHVQAMVAVINSPRAQVSPNFDPHKYIYIFHNKINSPISI